MCLTALAEERSFFESFMMPENLILDFVYCNDKVCMTIGTDFGLSAWALLTDG